MPLSIEYQWTEKFGYAEQMLKGRIAVGGVPPSTAWRTPLSNLPSNNISYFVAVEHLVWIYNRRNVGVADRAKPVSSYNTPPERSGKARPFRVEALKRSWEMVRVAPRRAYVASKTLL